MQQVQGYIKGKVVREVVQFLCQWLGGKFLFIEKGNSKDNLSISDPD